MAVAFQTVTGNHDLNATATGVTATFPSGVSVGDLLVLVVGCWNNPTVTVSGWTRVPNDTVTGAGTYTARCNTFVRIATSGDVSAGNVAISFSFADYWTWSIARYSGTDPSSPVHVSAAQGSTVNGTTITAPAITTTASGCLILQAWVAVYTAAAGSGALTLPATSRQTQFSSGGWVACGLSEQTQGSPGTAAAQTATTNSKTGSWVGLQFAIQPPVPVTGFRGWGIPL